MNYTAADAGCYVDGCRGIYAVRAIIDFANAHGASLEHDSACEGIDDEGMGLVGCEFANEYENEATDHMNDCHPVDGHYWGRSEQGDWGLWESEDN